MEIFLKDAMIVDGSGKAPYKSGIVISGERIAGITDETPESFSGRIIDCDGLTATPGFIDCHSHNDWFALAADQELFLDPFLLQGITTCIAGNCGFSVAGYDEDTPYKDQVGGGLFHLDESSEKANTLPKWLKAFDGNCKMNMALCVGHGTARIGVNGNKNTPLDYNGRERMLAHIEDALKNGACGVSLGLMYEPGIYAPYDELVDVAKLCVKYDKILTVHPRAESAISLSYKKMGRSHLLQALDELDRLVRDTGVRLEYSHLIFVGRRTWKDVDEALEILKKLKDDGFDAGFDMYPLDYGASIITVVLPDWYQAMTVEQRKRPITRLKLALMVHATIALLGFSFSDIRVAYAGKNRTDAIGKTIKEIAAERNMTQLNAYLEVCRDSDFKASVLMGSYQNDQIIANLMEFEQSLFMTDAWVERLGKQNGGIYGAFPRFIRLAMDRGWPIEKAVAKMTGQTASRFKLKDRGFIQEGCFADINIIDLKNFLDRIEEELPPLGIKHVFVNGQAVAQDGKIMNGANRFGRSIYVD